MRTQRAISSISIALWNHEKETYKWNSVPIMLKMLKLSEICWSVVSATSMFYHQYVLGIVGATGQSKKMLFDLGGVDLNIW